MKAERGPVPQSIVNNNKDKFLILSNHPHNVSCQITELT